jgi:hypothetical protein
MYSLMQEGRFGNSLRIWKNLRDYVESEYRGPTGLRSTQVAGAFHYHLPAITAITVGQVLEKEGKHVVFSESAPDHCRTFQGELCEVDGILELTYSTARTHMRAALKQASYASGPQARLILKQFLEPASYEDILELLDVYPKHVIEFTAFDCYVGPAKGRNTCIWEVRLY